MKNLFIRDNHDLFTTAREQLRTFPHSENPKKHTISNSVEQQAELCCLAMDSILANMANYDAVGHIPAQIQEHTVQMLQELPQDEAIFGLLEDLALITRGHTLFAQAANKDEQNFLQAFENAGEWQEGDGTIISDWYWRRLPDLAKSYQNPSS